MISEYCEYNGSKCKIEDAIKSIINLKAVYARRYDEVKKEGKGAPKKPDYPTDSDGGKTSIGEEYIKDKDISNEYLNTGKIFLKDITSSACVLLDNKWDGNLSKAFDFDDDKHGTPHGFNHYGRTKLWGSQDIAVNIGCRWDKEKPDEPDEIVIYTNVDIENSCSNRVRVNELTTSLQESLVNEGFANGIIEFGAISLGWRDNKNVESAPVLIPEFEMELPEKISSKYDYIENIYKSFVILKAISKYLNTTNAQKQNEWRKKIVDLVFSLKVANDLELDLSSTVMKINDLILEDNKQIILTGAPGTGKTYSSLEYIRWKLLSEYLKKIKEKKENYNKAIEEIKKNLKESDHKEKSKYFKELIGDKWAMVQFHPSFDYTDFVEGLRPAKIKVNQVQPATEGEKSTVSDSTQTSTDFVEGLRPAKIEVNQVQPATEGEKSTVSDSTQTSTDFVEGLRPAKIEVNQVQPATEGEKSTVSDSTQTSFVKIEGVFKKFCREVAEEENNSNNRYFFIDEVNRADLSKVFGELMYCLEEGYRGPEHSVKTQYSNLETYSIDDGEELAHPIIPDTVFKDGFYIPDNIIIIGSMNDIDRSVDTFDFALRRRFRWINIKVTEVDLIDTFRSMNKKAGASVDDISIVGYAKRIMKMNKIFESDDYKKMFGTPEDYYIGPAYFKSYFDGDSEDEIWGSKIVPLLREYVRGREEGEQFIKDCEDVYRVNNNTGTSKEDVLQVLNTNQKLCAKKYDDKEKVASLLSKALTTFDELIRNIDINVKGNLQPKYDLSKRLEKLLEKLLEKENITVESLKGTIVNAFLDALRKDTDSGIKEELKTSLLDAINIPEET